jgi:hypothetical protein
VTSSAVSRFEPVTIEILAGFLFLGLVAFAHALGLAVRQPVGLRLLVVLPLLRSLAGGSKIDKFRHVRASVRIVPGP